MRPVNYTISRIGEVDMGFKTERRVAISPVKYFNARLLHYSGSSTKLLKTLYRARVNGSSVVRLVSRF